ncbi:MAG: hypothetical protein IJ220_00025 [Clostridia bacterium]|nr:hypothetical protein [Clostridia bacterium]
MKFFNIKIDIKKILLISIFLIFLLLIIFLINSNTIINMNNSNFTSILRDSHENITKYLGKKISTTGYIFRGKDFSNTNFVIARDMLINETQANIVGFFCSYDYASEFENNEWVEATGTIVLGDYYGPIPMIKINTIKRITTPNDVFVYPPNKNN